MPTPETALKSAIKSYLQWNGWFVWHSLQGLGCYPGVADLTAIKEGRVLFIEVKTPRGRQSENQILFGNDVRTHGGTYKVVRSLDDIRGIA